MAFAGLDKAVSSLAVQMRTEKIGLADSLFRRRVPGVDSATCQCGYLRQTVKHVIMFCPDFVDRSTLRAGGAMNFRRLTETNAGIKAAAKWLMQTKLLKQHAVAETLLNDD